MAILRSRFRPRSRRIERRFATGSALALLFPIGAACGAAFLGGCETDDPCARRDAACVDVVLFGKKDDGMGGAIAYRNLQVAVFAPNVPKAPSAPVDAKCDLDMSMKPLLYGSELGPVGTPLSSSPVPDLTAMADYSAAVQGKLSFQLPDTFNALPDNDPATEVDAIPDDQAKIDRLKALRDEDQRAIRIIITQSGQQKSVWDSRCDEGQFSADEWKMKKYYRVGHNQYFGAWAVLAGAQTTSP